MTMTKFSRINKQREEITMRVLEDMEKGGNEWKNLSQKTASSREASTRLSDEIGVKPCTRDEGTVGDS